MFFCLERNIDNIMHGYYALSDRLMFLPSEKIPLFAFSPKSIQCRPNVPPKHKKLGNVLKKTKCRPRNFLTKKMWKILSVSHKRWMVRAFVAMFHPLAFSHRVPSFQLMDTVDTVQRMYSTLYSCYGKLSIKTIENHVFNPKIFCHQRYLVFVFEKLKLEHYTDLWYHKTETPS